MNSSQIEQLDLADGALKFHTPCAISITGSSQSGKSYLMAQLMEHRVNLFNTNFEQIYYCQPDSLFLGANPIFDKLRSLCPQIQLISGLPDVAKLNLHIDRTAKLLLVDDMMQSILASPQMLDLLTIQIHACNITLCFTMHNNFPQSKFGKTISRNVQYKFIFHNRLELTELRILSCQLGKKSSFLEECFQFLFETFPHEHHPYVMIDGHAQSPPPMKSLFIRTHILPINGIIKPIIFCDK